MRSTRAECPAASPARAGFLVGAAIVLASLVGSTAAFGQQSSPYNYGPHMWDWGGGWPMFFGPIWGLLFLGVLIALIVLVVRWASSSAAGGAAGAGTADRKTPLDILRERFARGEIDKDEFEERKRVLGA